MNILFEVQSTSSYDFYISTLIVSPFRTVSLKVKMAYVADC